MGLIILELCTSYLWLDKATKHKNMTESTFVTLGNIRTLPFNLSTYNLAFS